MRGYKPGTKIGNFEIIAQLPSDITTEGVLSGRYRVYCRACGEICEMATRHIRYRQDCGCHQTVYRRPAERKKPKPYMSEEEIFRRWKAQEDPQNGYTILAQLNAVPIAVIEEIIERQKARCELCLEN